MSVYILYRYPNDVCFFVVRAYTTELCSNKTLADVVKQRGCLTEPEAACYLREIVTAVSHLHAMVRGLTAGWIKLTYLEQCKMIGVNA